MTSNLQEQARALGDPTRHRVFRYVADARGPVDVAELTAHFGLNHNAIRQHLAKLVDAQLVIEDRAPSTGRGRRRLVYTVHPAADSRWGVRGPYERLSVLLAEILRTGDTPVEVGRRSVTNRRREKSGDPIATIVDAMARQGFDPKLRPRRDGVDVVLQTCPFESAAVADPESVCALHLGIAEGLAGLTDERVVVDELVPHDPRRANCRLLLSVNNRD